VSLPTFHIRVDQTKYEDYRVFSFYDIEARDYHDAEREARKQFCASFGFEMKDTEAFTFDKYKVQ